MCFLDDKVVIFLLWNPPGLHVWLRFFFFIAVHMQCRLWTDSVENVISSESLLPPNSDLTSVSSPWFVYLHVHHRFFFYSELSCCGVGFISLFLLVFFFFGCGLLLLQQLWWGVLFCFLVSLSFMFRRIFVFGNLGFALRYLFMRKNYVFWSFFFCCYNAPANVNCVFGSGSAAFVRCTVRK